MHPLRFLDQLRGLAILLVILTHLGTRIPLVSEFGQFGVQLFFLVSAYTLCLSWQERRFESRPVLSFFIRRYFRIAPAYLLGIAFYAWLAARAPEMGLQLSVVAESFSVPNVIANALLLHGFVPSANNSIVPGGWSIGTEATFYLLFPLLAWATGNFESRRRLVMITAFAPVMAICVDAAWDSLGHATGRFTYVYHSLACQLGVFAIGLVLCEAKTNRSLRSTTVHALGVLSVVLPLALVAMYWRQTESPVQAVVPWLVGISFIWPTLLLRSLDVPLKPLEWIGKISFSLYLCHFAVIWLVTPWLRETIPEHTPPIVRFVMHLVCILAISLPIAYASYRLVETPGQAVGRSLVRRLQGPKATS